jgi:undecaprenyl-diphosphatase
MRFVGVTAFLALVIAIGINQAIGYVAFTPRPFVVGLGTQLIEHRDSSSLPSNHATIFFTYAAVLLLLSKRALGLVFGLLGLLVAWSRIYLGIHYPIDMGAAALTSLVAALAATWLMARFGPPLLSRLEAIDTRLFGFLGGRRVRS